MVKTKNQKMKTKTENNKKEEWEIIDKQRVVDKVVGNCLTGEEIYFKVEYIIRNKKTGEIRRI